MKMSIGFVIFIVVCVGLMVYCAVQMVRNYLAMCRCDTDLKILRRRARNIELRLIPDPEDEIYN